MTNRSTIHRAVSLAGILVLVLFVSFGVAVTDATAQTNYVAATGRLLDGDGRPLVGYRVTFKPDAEAHTFVSGASDAEGHYVISLPEGANCTPIGLITSNGARVVLQSQRSLVARQGARLDIVYGASSGEAAAPRPADPAQDASLEASPPPAGQVRLSGVLFDMDERPLKGYRIVYRNESGTDVFMAKPSGDDGSYEIELPEDDNYTSVAVIAPNGTRYPLDDESPLYAGADLTHDVRLLISAPWDRPNMARNFNGADRLFLAFFTDAVIVEHRHWEGRLELATADPADTITSRFVGAWQFASVSDVEWGASIGVSSIDFDGGGSDSGLTDLDLSAKLWLGPGLGEMEWAVGGLLTVPVGDEKAGLGQDALSTLVYGALRQNYLWGTLAAHFGLRFTEDGRVGSLPLDGQIAADGGVAAMWPIGLELDLVGELLLESARFDGLDTGAQLLVGTNWSVSETVLLRGALTVGLADGSPDGGLTFGAAIDF